MSVFKLRKKKVFCFYAEDKRAGTIGKILEKGLGWQGSLRRWEEIESRAQLKDYKLSRNNTFFFSSKNGGGIFI